MCERSQRYKNDTMYSSITLYIEKETGSKAERGIHIPQVSKNNKASRFPQYFAAIITTMGGVICGSCLSWTSPTKDPLVDKRQYGFTISETEFSWIGSTLALGALFAAPFVGRVVDKIGRKMTILLLSVPAVTGWAIIAWSESVVMFCIGRFFTGFACGGYTNVLPLYIGEFSESSIRGSLGTFYQMQLNVGVLFSYIVGSLVSVFWLSVVSGALPILHAALMLFLPESPIFYLLMKRYEKARQALQWFRGASYDVEPELIEMQKNIEVMESERVPLLEAFSSVPAKKGLAIAMSAMFFQEFSGVNSVTFYSASIFKAVGSSLNPNLQSLAVPIMALIFTYVASFVVDKMGRKPLLLYSGIFMAICTFVIGLYFYLRIETTVDTTSIGLIPITAICIFIVAFALGYGSIPWIFMSEIFPRQISGYACSITCMFNWFCVFAVTNSFSLLNRAIGIYGTFWLYAAISVVGAFYVKLLVPETKGKTVEEVQIMLGGIE